MIRKSFFAAAALGLIFTAATPFAAENNYVPTRTILQQTDVPGSNYTVILALTDIAPGMVAARHTHPGVEISYDGAGPMKILAVYTIPKGAQLATPAPE